MLYQDRVIIPAGLRHELKAELVTTYQNCRSCQVSAPSQPSVPPCPLPSPEYPLQMICTDYFSYTCQKYLIVVDRFSNWLSVYHINRGDGDNRMVGILRHHFETYGAKSEIASDGGAEFVSGKTQAFL